MRDVVGYSLEEALAELEADGGQVEVKETAPPRAGRGTGRRRVVRQRLRDRTVELVAAWEWYERR